jgi:hypothetical protein
MIYVLIFSENSEPLLFNLERQGNEVKRLFIPLLALDKDHPPIQDKVLSSQGLEVYLPADSRIPTVHDHSFPETRSSLGELEELNKFYAS